MVDVPDLDGYRVHERDWESYEQLHETFEWEVPDEFNIADYVCDRWADEKSRVAVFYEDHTGEQNAYTFWQLSRLTDRLARLLEAGGVGRGDRVAVFMPQKPETLLAHIACWKVGAVSVPLSTLFGTSALQYRLSDCETVACFADATCLDVLREVAGDLDALDLIVTVDEPAPQGDEVALWEAIYDYETGYENAVMAPEDDAFIFYTSGTTGDPKGALHAQRFVLGCLPFFTTCLANLHLDDQDLVWAPPEWAWVGTLPSFILPSLYFGNPVLAYHGTEFEPHVAYDLVERYGVTLTLFPPTILRMMRNAGGSDAYDLQSIRIILTAGEALGQTILDWANEAFGGVTIHESYGQTELPGPIGDCTALGVARPEAMGKALPGHEVAIVDPETAEPSVDRGEVGELAVRREGDLAGFKMYWNRPDLTDEKVRNGWHLTEDLATMDEEGYITFVSRKDDVIISSGYRIGPEEIEDALAAHPDVIEAGVVGVPDDVRGEVPKAFVVLDDGVAPSEETKTVLQDHVKDTLAKYEYPRAMAFVSELPRTSTGKLQRNRLEE